MPDALVGHGRRRDQSGRRHATAWPHYDPEVVQGTVSSTAPRSTGRSSCTAHATPKRAGAIVGLQPKRAEVILAGACIVRTVMDKLGKPHLTVSDRGLRHGVLAERFGA